MTPEQISKAYHLLSQYHATIEVMKWMVTQELIPLRLGYPGSEEKITIHVLAPNVLELLSATVDKFKKELSAMGVEL
jgi:hypothetical protein